jgi:hypothetical protein
MKRHKVTYLGDIIYTQYLSELEKKGGGVKQIEASEKGTSGDQRESRDGRNGRERSRELKEGDLEKDVSEGTIIQRLQDEKCAPPEKDFGGCLGATTSS